MKNYLYKAEKLTQLGDYLDIDQTLIFSTDKTFSDENELKDIKFYINENNIVNNLQNGKFIGYLVSGEIECFSESLKFKTGNINNLSSDLLRAVKYLAAHLNSDISELPIQLYIVGQAALQYWNNKVRSTQDLDVYKTGVDENLFEQRKFLDLIKETDRYIKNLKENSDDHDLIINNDASFTGNFVFPMVYTKEIILENVLELYFADEEGASLNKTYAYFVQLLEEGRERTKDKIFAFNMFKKYGICSEEKLYQVWPEYRQIEEITFN